MSCSKRTGWTHEHATDGCRGFRIQSRSGRLRELPVGARAGTAFTKDRLRSLLRFRVLTHPALAVVTRTWIGQFWPRRASDESLRTCGARIRRFCVGRRVPSTPRCRWQGCPVLMGPRVIRTLQEAVARERELHRDAIGSAVCDCGRRGQQSEYSRSPVPSTRRRPSSVSRQQPLPLRNGTRDRATTGQRRKPAA